MARVVFLLLTLAFPLHHLAPCPPPCLGDNCPTGDSYLDSNVNIVVACISYSFPIAGLIVTGGKPLRTSIETFPPIPNCTIPPFPHPGNLSSFSSSHSPPKGDGATPSLLWTTVSSWSPAEGVTPRSLASLGAVAKIIGLTMRH